MATDRSEVVDRYLKAGERWQLHSEERLDQQRKLLEGGPVAADKPERVQAHLMRRLSRPPVTSRAMIGQERVIGDLNYSDFPPDAMAAAAGKPIARIISRPQDGYEAKGFGTGFLIAPGILITNHHVLPNAAAAAEAAANFGHERSERGVAQGTVVSFVPDSDRFITDAELDFTIVALERDAGLGHLPLLGVAGKILLGQPVNIIQHPNGGPKKYAVQENRLIDVLTQHLHYSTDTLPGASGSAAFNEQWEVVALHHSGVPMMRNGQILTAKGEVWDAERMSDDEILWVANEGVRVSCIVAHLQQLIGDPQIGAFAARALAQPVLPESATPNVSNQPLSFPPAESAAMTTTIHIHAPTTIYTGSATPAVMAPMMAPPSPPLPSLDAYEGISIDPDYGKRSGYEPKFLGTGSLEVNLPTLSPELQQSVAVLKNGDASGLLKYHHFSVVMHAHRKLAIFTAVNIDGKRGKRLERANDKWFFDPRLDRDFQVGDALYKANPLDRGHLVRRLDPAWGRLAVAKVANDDTFHFTNCSPQHANLNQKIWNDLEDYLLDSAAEDSIRLSVFTGAVFEASDPTYRGVQLPRRFWKVAVMKDTQGDLLAAGFIQSQAKMIRGLEEADFLRQEMRTDQFPIAQIEALTGLAFGLPGSADPLADAVDLQLVESVNSAGRPLNSLEEIRLR